MLSSPIGAPGNKTDWARVARGGEDCFIIFMFDHVMNHLTFDNTRPAGREHVISHQIPVISAINSSCPDPVMIYTFPCIPDLTVTVTRSIGASSILLLTREFLNKVIHIVQNIKQVDLTDLFNWVMFSNISNTLNAGLFYSTGCIIGLKLIVFIGKCS